MFKKCQHCGSTFKGAGNFCSDMCEIKNHASEIVAFKPDIITTEIKEGLNQVKEVLSKTPVPVIEIIDEQEIPIPVELDLKTSKVNI